MKKRVVLALGHRALGYASRAEGSNQPHGKMHRRPHRRRLPGRDHTQQRAPGRHDPYGHERIRQHIRNTACPMSVCSAMSQGYIGYDLQNGIREELLNRGIYRTVSTILTQVIVDTYDEAFYTPTKVLGRYMNAQEANEERRKGNYVIEEAGKRLPPCSRSAEPGKDRRTGCRQCTP